MAGKIFMFGVFLFVLLTVTTLISEEWRSAKFIKFVNYCWLGWLVYVLIGGFLSIFVYG